ncbi:GTP diphosphokinase, chloroplastic-like [Raphidocelis subcapitata]|uniref:GTP diphosphokinase n=1 Tax=Raphidocelis subcapitata TaxID=307507 RepID=A0A2V0P925_9CHLO|nr:GTP diphosphokinase, chloroplastic-like [Raphidocelis subcapitata]|eukprot:GBF96346.1 GTP diphosphokinase, chloroplastic-like [Raphidocelis subcapitata]
MMAPSVACSPPTTARSSALPIAPPRAAGATRLAARASADGAAAASVSEGAPSSSFSGRLPPRFSFSSTYTPRSQSIASLAGPAGRPPAGPAAVKAQIVGFAPLQELDRAPSGPLSPGRRETKPSLLSMALSDLPQPAFAQHLSAPAPPAHHGGAADMAPLDALAASHPVLDAPVVRAAYLAAARAHAGQARRSGEPVISHCLATAVILAELGLPEETVAAGLLHDVLSDTRVTAVQLEEHVPRSCVEMVEKVTRISELSQLYRDNAHSLEAGSILDMLTSMSDVGALLIKLADRLHNMRTIGALPRCKQVRVAGETLEVFAVLANRLGAWAVKAELEDLAFRTLQPEDYEAVSAAIAARAAATDLPARVAQAREALTAAGLEVVDVSGRVKNAYGVWRKLQKAGLGPERLGEVHDVAALRVVVPHKHDCYRALREVERLWAPVPGRFKDYVRARKANGYQSLHTGVVPGAAAGAGAGAPAPAASSTLEVQIRTPKMHYIAEYGFAAHWRYKESLPREDVWLDRLVQWKKWVATEKLRLRDAKVRAGGSPQRDPALASLVEAARAAADAAAAAAASLDGGDSTAAAAAALAAAAPAGSASASASADEGDLDARFMARFSIAPVSDADLEAQPASIVVTGPRGVRVEGVPARCTLAQLLASGAVSEQEARGCSLQLNGRAVPLLARREVQLRPGDHVAFVAEPNLVPRARAPVGADDEATAAAAAAAAAAASPGDVLEVYLPGQAAPVAVRLRRPAAASQLSREPAALVS